MRNTERASRVGIGISVAVAAVAGAVVGVRSLKLYAGGGSGASSLNVLDAAHSPVIKVSVGAGAFVNRGTPASSVADGDAHTRCVVTGVPYSFTFTLPERVTLTKLSVAPSDWAKEASPKDLTLEFDDGTKQDVTLARQLSTRGDPAWQDFPLPATASQTVRVTVKSVYPGEVAWGGIGEIALWTDQPIVRSAEPPIAGSKLTPFIHSAPGATAQVLPAVRLPERVASGAFPRTILTADEFDSLKKRLNATPKGQASLKALARVADPILRRPIEFPDPAGPQGQAAGRGDDAANKHDRLALDCGTLGRAYALTGNRAYAEKAAAILVGYAERYAQYPEHKGANPHDTGKVMAQRLSEAMWLIPLALSYDAIHDSTVLTAADRAAIEGKLLRPCIEFIWRKSPAQIAAERDKLPFDWREQINPDPKARMTANWLIYYNSATMLVGAILEDQSYLDVAAANLRQLIHDGIGEDGLWNEGAIGYQYFLMNGLLPGIETAARHGIDLWSFADNRLKKLFDSPGMYAYPDGSMPGINDSGRVKPGGWQEIAYDYAYARYGDERYAAVVNKAQRQLHTSPGVYLPTLYYDEQSGPAQPAYPSTLFPSAGLAIFRDAGRYALLKYGAHGGVHGHYDKLNLILFGNGDELGGEPTFYAYEKPLHGEWTKQTVSHNTMTIDGRSQAESAGRLLAFEPEPPVKIVRAEATEAYPGSALDRTIVSTPDGIFDVFLGRSGRERQWDRTFRFLGTLAADPSPAAHATTTSATLPARLGLADGYQHLAPQRAWTSGEAWHGVWTLKGRPFGVTIAPAPGQTVYATKDADGADLVLARQQGPQACVVARYTFEGQPAGDLATLDSGSPTLRVVRSTRTSDGVVETLWIAAEPGRWQAHGVASDASVLYVRQKGTAVEAVAMTGGTSVEVDGARLTLDSAGNGYAEGAPGGLRWVTSWRAPASADATP